MLTREQVLEQIKAGRKAQCLDGRDYRRLSVCFPLNDLEAFGLKLAEDFDTSKYVVVEWTREKILEQLRGDVRFGFEKAHNQRSISASFMHDVVKMWMWVLEDDELYRGGRDNFDDYGVSFLEEVAEKYGLPIPTD